MMKQPLLDKIQPLFDVAISLDPSKRALLLEGVGGSDPELRKHLEALLSVDRKSTRSLLAPGLNVMSGDDSEEGGRNHSDTIVTSPSLVPLNGNATRSERVAQDPEVLRAGTRLHHYELIREIGRGGMGTVYLARDIKLGRRVAIKVLHTNDRQLVERFLLEARATARCNHENIVVIHDVNEYCDTPYMVLEFLKGTPLNQLVGDEPVSPSRAVQLMVPVVRALMCAHEQRIVHRDLKPANIFMSESGTIKVLDFGIAKVLFSNKPLDTALPINPTVQLPKLGTSELTHRGVLIGTLPYMSPEQWGAGSIDHRTDIWAVGIMLYHLIVGRHPLAPLEGEQLVATAVLDQPMPSISDSGVDLPLGLAEVIDSCLHKHKEQRIASAAELLSVLEPYLPGQRTAAIRAEECPYAGLNAFQEADASRFFGRKLEIGTILARLHAQPLIGLIGPSGVGKSSLVRAGVIPALEESGDAWESMVIRPGRHPMAALANLVMPKAGSESNRLSEHVAEHQSALQRLYREPGYLGAVLRERALARQVKILLFVDQFEELFTMSPDTDERLAFTACLAGMADDGASPLRLILSIRSDFLDRVAEDRHFMAELSQNLIFIAPPNREGLRDAIVRPAEMVRYRFESVVMVEHMLDTLQVTPGCLPLLQFAAAKLWDARDRDRRVLTEESYDELGGVVGALATHADAVLASMSPRDQALVRTIFLQLVTPDRTRAIKSFAELREFVGLPDRPEAVEEIIARLVDARLLVVQRGKSSGGTVEIVHESLTRSWPTLAHWLDENQEDAVLLEQLQISARQWQARGRTRELLWRGETMHEARAWYTRYKGTLPALQTAFLQACFANELRAKRIRRVTVVGTIVFLSALVAAASIALVIIRNAEQHAQRRSEEAQLARIEADARTKDAELARADTESALKEARRSKSEATAAKEIALTEQKKSEDRERARDELIEKLAHLYTENRQLQYLYTQQKNKNDNKPLAERASTSDVKNTTKPISSSSRFVISDGADPTEKADPTDKFFENKDNTASEQPYLMTGEQL